jgi:hypothetical protein
MSEGFSIKTSIQLAIFIANRPGTLAHACEALAKADINIEALATEGTFGTQNGEMLVRMVVNDPAKAVSVLGEVGATVIQTDVLLIEGKSQPGFLAKIAERLGQSEINIESVYVSAGTDLEKCLVILRPSNVESAMRVLQEL